MKSNRMFKVSTIVLLLVAIALIGIGLWRLTLVQNTEAEAALSACTGVALLLFLLIHVYRREYLSRIKKLEDKLGNPNSLDVTTSYHSNKYLPKIKELGDKMNKELDS